MKRTTTLFAGLMLCLTFTLSTSGKDAEKPKAKIEIRWVEMKFIEGVTEKKGFQCSCAEGDVAYPHKLPAMVLTKEEVSSTKLLVTDWSKSGLGVLYRVQINLKKEAREKLANTFEGKETRLLTITVDGRNWGVSLYEKDKDKKFVPEQVRAETFTPEIGFLNSEAEAQAIIDALK